MLFTSVVSSNPNDPAQCLVPRMWSSRNIQKQPNLIFRNDQLLWNWPSTQFIVRFLSMQKIEPKIDNSENCHEMLLYEMKTKRFRIVKNCQEHGDTVMVEAGGWGEGGLLSRCCWCWLCQWCRQRCLCLSRVDLLTLHPVWPSLSLQFPARVWWLLPGCLADSHQDNLLLLLLIAIYWQLWGPDMTRSRTWMVPKKSTGAEIWSFRRKYQV